MTRVGSFINFLRHEYQPTMNRRKCKGMKKRKRKRKYPPHKGTKDYSIFFERIKEGTFLVDCQNAKFYTRKSGRHINSQWREKFTFVKHGYIFVEVKYNYKRRAIAIHRLIYMIANNTTKIPKGYDVDHIDHNRENNHPSNLRLRLKTHNRSDNGKGNTKNEFYDESKPLTDGF